MRLLFLLFVFFSVQSYAGSIWISQTYFPTEPAAIEYCDTRYPNTPHRVIQTTDISQNPYTCQYNLTFCDSPELWNPAKKICQLPCTQRALGRFSSPNSLLECMADCAVMPDVNALCLTIGDGERFCYANSLVSG